MTGFTHPVVVDAYHRRRMLIGMTKGREAVAAFDRAQDISACTLIINHGGTFIQGRDVRSSASGTYDNAFDALFPPGSPTRRLADVTLPDGRTIYGMTAVDCARDRGVALPSNAAWHSAPIQGPGYVQFPPDWTREQRWEWLSRQPLHSRPSTAQRQ